MKVFHNCVLGLLVIFIITACSKSKQPMSTVMDAYWTNELSTDRGSYIPKTDHTFLVVRVTFKQTKMITSNDLIVITEDGKTFSAVGIALDEKSPLSEGKSYIMKGFQVFSSRDTFSQDCIFSIPNDSKEQTFKLKFQEGSPVSFSVKQKSQ